MTKHWYGSGGWGTAAAPYGLHGARVEGWNATRATLGGDLATAQGGWNSAAKTRYDRFTMARVCRIPSAIVGQLEEHEGDRELEREVVMPQTGYVCVLQSRAKQTMYMCNMGIMGQPRMEPGFESRRYIFRPISNCDHPSKTL